MKWTYEKFSGDGAIYAFCPHCGFYHNPSRLNSETMEVEVVLQYNFCPNCGKYLAHNDDEIEVVWNERDMNVLYESKPLNQLLAEAELYDPFSELSWFDKVTADVSAWVSIIFMRIKRKFASKNKEKER